MTKQEAQGLIAAIAAAWPSPRIPQATIALYRSELERLKDYDAAKTAIHGLISTSRYLPTIAELKAVYRIGVRRNAEQRAETRGLSEAPGVPMPPEVKEQLDRLFNRVEAA